MCQQLKENAWLSRNVVQGTEQGKIIQPTKLTPRLPVDSRFSGKLRPNGRLVPSFPPPASPTWLTSIPSLFQMLTVLATYG